MKRTLSSFGSTTRSGVAGTLRCCLLVFLLTGCVSAARSSGVRPGTAAPANADVPQHSAAGTSPSARTLGAGRVLNLQGLAVELSEEAAGRPAIVDLWASWCVACKRTHTRLTQLAQEYAPETLYIAGVNVGESPATVERYLGVHAFTYSVYLDPEFEFAESLGLREIPMLYVLNAQGVIVHRSHQLE